MIVVSDSSPIITLAKTGLLPLLPALYDRIVITPEVYNEIVVHGAGLAGSSEIRAANWVEVRAAAGTDEIEQLRGHGLGAGESSAIILARELRADLLLMDEIRARKTAQQCGLMVLGCVGILQDAHRMRLIPDLRDAFHRLIESGAYIDRRILAAALRALDLPDL